MVPQIRSSWVKKSDMCSYMTEGLCDKTWALGRSMAEYEVTTERGVERLWDGDTDNDWCCCCCKKSGMVVTGGKSGLDRALLWLPFFFRRKGKIRFLGSPAAADDADRAEDAGLLEVV